jgi:hypothetical protein
MIILNTVNDMKTKVIDIRKHDPEKVVAYWVSQGGKDVDESLCDDPKEYPYCGIDDEGDINAWSNLDGRELIDLPEEEFKTGDRVVDEHGDLGTYIGCINDMHYYEMDKLTYNWRTQDATKIKHYKEPELFEGWVNIYNNHVWKTKEEALYCSSGGRVFKVREVKDEG